MRKIGILTFHWANSFGAILQACALNKLLIDMGYDAEIINFLPGLRLVTSRVIKPHELARKYSAMGFSLIRGAYSASGEAINYIFDFKEYLCRDRLFGDFRKKFMKISPQVVNDVSELKKTCQEYDACLVGSDQVWNPEYLHHSDFAYLLPFKLKETKKIAFSASLGVDISSIPLSLIKLYKAALSDFSLISLRERKQSSALSSLIGKEIHHTLDPTLLVDKEQFETIMGMNIPGIDKYVLIYNIDFTTLPLAKKIVEILKLPAIIYSRPPLLPITRRLTFSRYFKGAPYFSSLGPREFLGLIRNAEFIITDSFHGSALSILFQKQFVTLIAGLNVKTQQRILDLLEQFKLNKRLLSEKSFHYLSKIIYKPINYDHVRELLASMQRNSLKLLDVALKSAY
jgi:hypothetical protein